MHIMDQKTIIIQIFCRIYFANIYIAISDLFMHSSLYRFKTCFALLDLHFAIHEGNNNVYLSVPETRSWININASSKFDRPLLNHFATYDQVYVPVDILYAFSAFFRNHRYRI